MSQKISTKSIEDITETLIDYRGKTPEKSPSGIKLITAKVIKDGRIADENHEYISEGSYDLWMRRGLPKEGDILITTEAPLGEVAMLRTSEKIALAQRVILLRGNPEIIDQNYYFQALKSPFVLGELYSRGTGTTVLGIKQSELRKVRIPYFELAQQRKIADILSAYDDLIENNTRRIALLEGMARALYREWFVEFRFPGHGALEGGVPEGWTAGKLGNYCFEVRRGVQPNEVDPETPYVGLEHIPRRSLALDDWGRAADVQSTKLRFEKGEILFGKIRPYFHKVAVAPVSGVCSTDAIVIVPRAELWFSLVLACVSSDEFVAHSVQTSNGTKMPRANWEVLTRYPIVIPPIGLLEKFNAFIENTVAEIKNHVLRNRNLRATRDLLLPKLISGALDVSMLEGISTQTLEAVGI